MRVGLLGSLAEDVGGGPRPPLAVAGMQESGTMSTNLGTSNGMTVGGLEKCVK